MAKPPPITNSPDSAPAYQRWVENWPNIAAPTAISPRLSARPFFMPVSLSTAAAGSASRK